jgi:hypothetical protein
LWRSGHHLQIQVSGIFRGGSDGVVHIEFFRGTCAREAPQTPQRHLDVAGTQFDRIVQIAEFATIPYFHCAAIARDGLTDPHALGVIPVGSER